MWWGRKNACLCQDSVTLLAKLLQLHCSGCKLLKFLLFSDWLKDDEAMYPILLLMEESVPRWVQATTSNSSTTKCWLWLTYWCRLWGHQDGWLPYSCNYLTVIVKLFTITNDPSLLNICRVEIFLDII
jgi:hypothetical protein